MGHYFYITPEEYSQAAKNGIDANRLEVRLRQYGWSKERAINEPLGEYTNRAEWAKIAEANGIKYQTFMSRINIMGMSEEVAATKPLQDKQKMVQLMADRKRQIPLDLRELAESNGIGYKTFSNRLDKGYSYEEAATIPLNRERYSTEDSWKASLNGINKRAYGHRIKSGWPSEIACVAPIGTKLSEWLEKEKVES